MSFDESGDLDLVLDRELKGSLVMLGRVTRMVITYDWNEPRVVRMSALQLDFRCNKTHTTCD